MERITACAKEINAFLKRSGLTETDALIRFFVKECVSRPAGAPIHYSPAPEDNAIGGAYFAEAALTPE